MQDCNTAPKTRYVLATAAAKEEAEQADKQRREAEAALKKEDEATEGSAAQDSTVKPEDTVNTGSQSVIQARMCYLMVTITIAQSARLCVSGKVHCFDVMQGQHL